MQVILGLGSNVGNRLGHLREAIKKLRSLPQPAALKIHAISPIYESEALLLPGAPNTWNQPFLNLALRCETPLSPPDLLIAIKSIEKAMDRIQRGRWAPREIDIDILDIPGTVWNTEELKIPHPHLMQRPFAFLPMADVLDTFKIDFRQQTAQPLQIKKSKLILPELMGILNITQDSFSDGGNNLDPQAALQSARKLLADGATLLDIGAESTRPGATPLSVTEEWSRLKPVLVGLQELLENSAFPSPFQISLDTRHWEIVQRALELTPCIVHWINDVTGFNDPQIQQQALQAQKACVAMHSLSIPASQEHLLPIDQDPIHALLKWGHAKRDELLNLGIPLDRIILDPGIGFGKTMAQNWYLLAHAQKLHSLGVDLLVGHSRKSFLTTITEQPAAMRDLETAVLSVELAKKGIQYLRVHDVQSTQRALQVWNYLDGVIHLQ